MTPKRINKLNPKNDMHPVCYNLLKNKEKRKNNNFGVLKGTGYYGFPRRFYRLGMTGRSLRRAVALWQSVLLGHYLRTVEDACPYNNTILTMRRGLRTNYSICASSFSSVSASSIRAKSSSSRWVISSFISQRRW